MCIFNFIWSQACQNSFLERFARSFYSYMESLTTEPKQHNCEFAGALPPE